MLRNGCFGRREYLVADKYRKTITTEYFKMYS